MAYRGRCGRCFLHGCDRWRNVAHRQGRLDFSRWCSLRWIFECCPGTITSSGRAVCSVGWNIRLLRLHTHCFETEGRSVEFYYFGSGYRWNSGCTCRTPGHGECSCSRRRTFGIDRRNGYHVSGSLVCFFSLIFSLSCFRFVTDSVSHHILLDYRLTRAFAPPVPTSEDMEMAMRQDVTAPPTQGGLFPTGMLGGRSSPPTQSPSSTEPPPEFKSSETFYSDSGTTTTTSGQPHMANDTTTSFSGYSSAQDSSSNETSSWWPFSK